MSTAILRPWALPLPVALALVAGVAGCLEVPAPADDASAVCGPVLYDDFDDPDAVAEAWDGTNAPPTVESGALVVATIDQQREWVVAGPVEIAGSSGRFDLVLGGGDDPDVKIYVGGIGADASIAFGTGESNYERIDYHPVVHRYWRIRVVADSLELATSPDGEAFEIQRTMPYVPSGPRSLSFVADTFGDDDLRATVDAVEATVDTDCSG